MNGDGTKLKIHLENWIAINSINKVRRKFQNNRENPFALCDGPRMMWSEKARPQEFSRLKRWKNVNLFKARRVRRTLSIQWAKLGEFSNLLWFAHHQSSEFHYSTIIFTYSSFPLLPETVFSARELTDVLDKEQARLVMFDKYQISSFFHYSREKIKQSTL